VSIPDQIRSRRLALGLTQTEAAERARTSQSAWAQYEKGGKTPDLGTMERIAYALGSRWVQRDDGWVLVPAEDQAPLSPSEWRRIVVEDALRGVPSAIETGLRLGFLRREGDQIVPVE